MSAESGRNNFPREEHSNWLSGIRWPALRRTHTDDIMQPGQAIFRNKYVYAYTCTHLTKANGEKRGMKLKESKEGFVGGFERKKRERKMLKL